MAFKYYLHVYVRWTFSFFFFFDFFVKQHNLRNFPKDKILNNTGYSVEFKFIIHMRSITYEYSTVK